MTNPSRSWCRKELGHVLLHDPASTAHGGRAGTRGAAAEASTAACRGVQEGEAESVAYSLVTTSAGLDTGGYTFPYVAGWAGSVNGTEPETIVRDTGTRVLRAATTVLAALEHDTTDVDEPLATRIAVGADRTADLLEHAERTG